MVQSKASQIWGLHKQHNNKQDLALENHTHFLSIPAHTAARRHTH